MRRLPASLETSPDQHERVSPLRRARVRLSGGVGWRDAVAVGVLIAAFAIPLRGLLRYQGPPMEEGFMLTFPQEVLRGAVPNRDFLHLYGPGSLWALAGAFKVFGTSLATERFFGLAQHAGIVFGVFALARPWGRWLATICGLTSLLIILPPVGLTAMAWNGAVALGLWGVWSALGFHRGIPAAKARRLLFTGGALGGLALLFRPDLVIAVLLGLGAVVWGTGRRNTRPLFAGLAAGFAPMLVHVAMAGPGHAFVGMVVEPVFKLRSGRSLPVPPAWSHLDGFLQKAAGLQRPGWSLPSLATPHQVFLWFFLTPASALFVAAVGVWAYRRQRGSLRARVLLAGGLFSVGMLSQGVQRPDTAHFAWVSCVPVALLPVAVTEAARLAGRPRRDALRFSLGRIAGSALVVGILAGIIPHFTVRTYVDLTQQTFGHNVFGFPVHRAGRNVYYGSQKVADAANALIADLDAQDPRPGERLFVGPVDLRRTPYSDAYFYFLYPKLVPATYYIEMDPFDTKPGSRLTRDVRSANWLILSGVWANWDEPNDSRRLGSDAPNRVVRQHFCKLGEYGHREDSTIPLFELWKRCR